MKSYSVPTSPPLSVMPEMTAPDALPSALVPPFTTPACDVVLS